VTSEDHCGTGARAARRAGASKEPFPAWTAVGVTALYEPEAIVEISVRALVP